jgi:hypothetical protein
MQGTGALTTKLGTLSRARALGALVVEYEDSGPLPARSILAFDEATPGPGLLQSLLAPATATMSATARLTS